MKVVAKLNQLVLPPRCMSQHPGFKPVVLNPSALENALQVFRRKEKAFLFLSFSFYEYDFNVSVIQ